MTHKETTNFKCGVNHQEDCCDDCIYYVAGNIMKCEHLIEVNKTQKT